MPLVDLSNPLNSDGVRQIAGPFGSILGPGATFPNSYEFGKRFLQLPQTIQASDGVSDLDDPTYLGFSLSFDPISPLFNGYSSGTSDIQTVTQGPSAISYLEKIGESNRASYLKSFLNGIKKINDTRPYYWQTIEGLSDAWKKNTSFMSDPFIGGDDSVITIGCLEAIDLKITALFSLYRMSVYDIMYRRQIVPQNLLKFNVTVSVYEIRKFKTVRNWIRTFNSDLNQNDSLNFINENTSQVQFSFQECMWVPEESGEVFSKVSNTSTEIATTSIKFLYNNMFEVSQFSGYENQLAQNKRQVESRLFNEDNEINVNALSTFGKEKLNNAANGALNSLERSASSAIQGITLGNVFGIRNELLSGISNPQILQNAILGSSIQDSQSLNNRIGDRLFSTVPSGPSISPSKIFDEPIDSSQELDTNRLFGPANLPTNNDGLQSPTISGNQNAFDNRPSGPSLTSSNIFR